MTMKDKKFNVMLSQSIYWAKEITVNEELRKEYEWIDSSLSDREFAIEVAKDGAIFDEVIDGGKLTVDDAIEVNE